MMHMQIMQSTNAINAINAINATNAIKITDYKYVLLILNCKKYKWKADKQKSTWLPRIPDNVCYLHVIGRGKTHEACELDLPNHVLYTNTQDDYVSLPHKVIAALKAVNEWFEYTHIYKTDDDQLLIQPNFFVRLDQTLSAAVPALNYGGLNIRVNDHYSNYHTVHSELPTTLFLEKNVYCNGRFYFLSKAAVLHLIPHESEISKRIIEDHAVGFYLGEQMKTRMCNIDTGKIFADIERFTNL
jgi:hypothetical protein